jgi:RNA polymerase sigma-70 factor (ECF subfamily)
MDSTPVSLLEQLRQPCQPEAWQRFVALYAPLLFAWARRTGLQEPDAADLVQDVFAVLVEKLPSFEYERGGSFRAWLRTILANKWRDHQRRRGVRPRQASAPDLDGLAAPDAVEEFADAEFRQQLARRALELMRSQFEATTWKACWETVVEGRPAAAVAAEFGVREGTVYAAKCRVLRRLREELRGMLD